jgi:hypothetical protein
MVAHEGVEHQRPRVAWRVVGERHASTGMPAECHADAPSYGRLHARQTLPARKTCAPASQRFGIAPVARRWCAKTNLSFRLRALPKAIADAKFDGRYERETTRPRNAERSRPS